MKVLYVHVRNHNNTITFVVNTSEQTPQVASSAVHMYVRASKLRDVKDKCMLSLSTSVWH